MKHKLTANKDIDRRIGNTYFVNKLGESREFSSEEAEIALSTGDYDYDSEVPETDAEKAKAKEAEKSQKELDKLNATSKDKLVNQAAKAGIEAKGLKKAELVDALAAGINSEPVTVSVKGGVASSTLAPGEGVAGGEGVSVGGTNPSSAPTIGTANISNPSNTGGTTGVN